MNKDEAIARAETHHGAVRDAPQSLHSITDKGLKFNFCHKEMDRFLQLGHLNIFYLAYEITYFFIHIIIVICIRKMRRTFDDMQWIALFL